MDKKEKVYAFFKDLNIPYTVVSHLAIFSEKDDVEIHTEGEICKNLFLKDRHQEEKFYLVCLPLHKRANIKKVEQELGVKKLSFGNEQELLRELNITPGSVSILNVIEAPHTQVEFLLDEELKNLEKVCFHPNDNTASISFCSRDLDKILQYYHVKYRYIHV